MTSRRALLALLALGLAVLLALAWRSARTLREGLPLRIAVATQAEAQALAPGAVPVLGTGSMAPYIPAARAGLDPLTTVCAYVVLVPNARYTEITPGALCIYVPAWAGRNVMHQAAQLDAGGWIMTGLNNKGYETSERVTARNFVGLVARTYVWPQ
jgi:hypothetical protein